MALLRRLSTATAVTTLALVAIGGVVRATDSGDACPQWPGCFPGRILPPLESHALIEFSHRLAVVLVTALIVATVWVAWRRERRDPFVFWPLVALVMITATAARMRRRSAADRDPAGPGFRRLTWWTLGATAVLLLAGAYVRGEGAGLVFLDWPLMNGRFIPELSGEPTVANFLHRALAAVAVALGVILAWRSRAV